ncbi:hypothetical protein JCM10213v2_005258 [Rhodosporidiobolus nylandii]
MASSVASQMSRLTLAGPARPGGGGGGQGGGGGGVPMKRPGFGTVGNPVKVRINAFAIRPFDMVCYHYDVKIGPTDEKRPARLNRAIWAELVRSQNPFGQAAVAYDGRAMAYSPTRLPADQGQWTVNLPEADGSVSRGNRFTLRISFIRPIQLGALAAFVSSGGRGPTAVDEGAVMSAIQALNVAIQHGPFQADPSRGPSFFLRGNNPQTALGIEMWRGYYSSLRPGIGGVFLNLDITSQPFFAPGNLPDVMLELLRHDRARLQLQDLARIPGPAGLKLNRMLKSLRITRTVRDQDGRFPKRKIKGIVSTSAAQSTFQLEDGSTTNVAAYFQTHLRCTLRHPEWPCVQISRSGLWPMEVCTVDVGQKYGKKLTPATAISNIRPSNAQAFQQWNIALQTTPLEVPARVLQPPAITYANPQRPIRPNEGTWNLRNERFSRPASFDRWVVFVFSSPQSFPQGEVQQNVTAFAQELQRLGLRIGNLRPQIHYAPPNLAPNQVDAFFRSKVTPNGPAPPGFKALQGPELLVCYLPTKPSPYYAPIKRFSDQIVGCASQCLNIQKARRANQQYWSNVALKLNAKLGGVNSTASLGSILSKPTVVFGADVSHPAPGSFAPSVVGVVASMDPTVTKYASRLAVQSSRVEVIQDLANLVQSLLQQFHATTKKKPEKIVFFRDGVSEGQFSQVINHEVNAIRLACQKIDQSFKPAITFIVTGKRHKISMFPADRAAEDGKTGNVKAGTTVDQVIGNPFTFDWYTQSHGSLLGTSRSCKYTTLVDDSRFSADELQQLCYNICYAFPRCTRSVSYASPAYLADVLCGRGALLLGTDIADDVSVASGQSAQVADQQLAMYRSRLRAIHPNLATSLFFM